MKVSCWLCACSLFAACADDAVGLLADAATAQEPRVPLDALAALGKAPDACQRDEECDGVAASCDPVQHVCLMRCPALVIDGPRALAAARRCREIEGNLIVRSSELQTIGPQDLPYLERVTGSLICAAVTNLRELSLPALRVVGTEKNDSLVEIGLDGGNLTSISLPSLRSVHGSVGIIGLYGLRDLDLGALVRVEVSLVLSNLPRLSWLALDPELYTGELLQLEYLCSLPADTVSAPASAALKTIGCCTEQRTHCDGDLLCRCEHAGDAPTR